MKCKLKRIIIIVIGMVLPVFSAANGEWKFICDNDGINLYVREVSEHSEAEFKSVGIVNRPIEAVGAVLSDTTSYPRWFFKCIEAKKIPAEDTSASHFFLYVAIDTPWPFSDRDAVYETKIAVNHAQGKVVIHSTALKEARVPIRANFVRITDSELQWTLERISAAATRITFINRTNAAGPLADYLSNPGMRDTSLNSLQNLKKILDRLQNSEIIKP